MPLNPNIVLLSQGFDYSATLLWAVSGAMIGARKGYAILGIFVLALVSSTGGGCRATASSCRTARRACFGRRPT